MALASAEPHNWQPETTDQRDAVLQELERVLRSPHFCNSKRYPAFLQYVVLRTLEGTADSLKERTIGIEVFNRPADYDTNNDTVVRYTAGEVRKRLYLYNASRKNAASSENAVFITLPSGSYVPEFTKSPVVSHVVTEAAPVSDVADLGILMNDPIVGSKREPEKSSAPQKPYSVAKPWKKWLIGSTALAAIASIMFGTIVRHRTEDPAQQFWAPLVHEQAHTIVCSGGVVFSHDQFSGTLTAGKDIDYPFVSMQVASAISKVSGELERGKVPFELEPCTSTSLSELRDHPVVLLGGYNNDWTMRLLAPLRFSFGPEPMHAILDREHPGQTWSRDKALPYSNSDDYALVARFRDATTGDLIIVLAGVGRNGTEAAAQFATSPMYMKALRDKIGHSLGDSNIEAVLKISVVDGKTGAPTIQAVHTW